MNDGNMGSVSPTGIYCIAMGGLCRWHAHEWPAIGDRARARWPGFGSRGELGLGARARGARRHCCAFRGKNVAHATNVFCWQPDLMGWGGWWNLRRSQVTAKQAPSPDSAKRGSTPGRAAAFWRGSRTAHSDRSQEFLPLEHLAAAAGCAATWPLPSRQAVRVSGSLRYRCREPDTTDQTRDGRTKSCSSAFSQRP